LAEMLAMDTSLIDAKGIDARTPVGLDRRGVGETGIDALQGQERANHQAGANQQNQSHPTGGKIVGVVMSHFGTEEEGQRAIRPIRELGSVMMDTVARIPYCAVQRQLD